MNSSSLRLSDADNDTHIRLNFCGWSKLIAAIDDA
jgi:hypothetical protein